MAVDATIEVAGIKDALRVLNKIEPGARRELTRNYKKVMEGVRQDVKDSIPFGPPLSGMAYNWTTKSGTQIFPWADHNNNVRVGVSGKKVREFSGFLTNLATFYLRYDGPSAVVVDMAGKGKVPTKQGATMVAALSRKFRSPSRFLWPAWERNKPQVIDEIKLLVDDLMRRTSRELM